MSSHTGEWVRGVQKPSVLFLQIFCECQQETNVQGYKDKHITFWKELLPLNEDLIKE